MKKLFALALLATLPATAGTHVESSKAPIPPPANPCIFTWFAGGSVGYLTEFEEVMYTLHIGTDTCWNLAGWDISLFAEVGYTEKDERYTSDRQWFVPHPRDSYTLDQYEAAMEGLAFARNPSSFDLEIIPITGNIKFERNLTGNLNAYFGGGLGMARVDLSRSTAFGNRSDDDWVFTAQLFAGLNYNITPSFEVFGGARWIYFDDAELKLNGFADLKLEDDFLFEIGARYNF